jgi:outer membrane protein
MQKKILSLAAALVLSQVPALSDILGGELAIGTWHHDPSGWIEYPTGSDRIDLDDDLALSTDTELYARLKLEHPLPVLPNIMLAYTKNSNDGTGTISRNFTFGDVTFNASERVYTKTQLDSYDLTLYYEIIDTGFDLDLGLTARYIDGYAEVTSLTTGLGDRADFEVVLPLVYANVNIPLPLTSLEVSLSGSGITYDSNTLYDIQAALRYRLAMGLGLEGGYRAQKIKIDDIDNTSADIDIDGFFFGISWDF